MKIVDRFFGWILVVSGVLHGVGCSLLYKSDPMTLLWALCGSLAALLVAAINLLRTGRPNDRPVAWIALVGSVTWVAVSVAFLVLIGNILDPRGLIHGITALVLAGFSAKTLFGGGKVVFSD
jgi:uncharacterized membrane protein (UPF0136 family)